MIYIFEKEIVNLDQLTDEIRTSEITRNLNYLSHVDEELTVVFYANLLGSDEVILNELVSGHIAVFTPQVQQVALVANKSYANITGNMTSVVKSGSGKLHSVIINNNKCGGTITIYDNTAASGVKIGTLDAGSPSGGLLSTSGVPGANGVPFGVNFNTGLTVVTSGSNLNDVTVLYE